MDKAPGCGARDSDKEHAVAHDAQSIPVLIETLSNRDGLQRQAAREALVHIGDPAVAPLIAALGDSREHVRWEAAKALGQMCNPAAAPALVRTLEDREGGVRWVAAHALISMERLGVAPLLEALMSRSNSVLLRDGAHHVLRALCDGELAALLSPVLAALDGAEPVLQAPVAAQAALAQLNINQKGE